MPVIAGCKLTERLRGSWRWMTSLRVKLSSVSRSFQYFCLMFNSSTACTEELHSWDSRNLYFRVTSVSEPGLHCTRCWMYLLGSQYFRRKVSNFIILSNCLAPHQSQSDLAQSFLALIAQWENCKDEAQSHQATQTWMHFMEERLHCWKADPQDVLYVALGKL